MLHLVVAGFQSQVADLGFFTQHYFTLLADFDDLLMATVTLSSSIPVTITAVPNNNQRFCISLSSSVIYKVVLLLLCSIASRPR